MKLTIFFRIEMDKNTQTAVIVVIYKWAIKIDVEDVMKGKIQNMDWLNQLPIGCQGQKRHVTSRHDTKRTQVSYMII
jgi:hypothetical protein